MGKLQFCSGLSGRRLFMRNCVLLGAGAAVFGTLPEAARKPAEGKGGFVLINGWVVPSRYLVDGQP